MRESGLKRNWSRSWDKCSRSFWDSSSIASLNKSSTLLTRMLKGGWNCNFIRMFRLGFSGRLTWWLRLKFWGKESQRSVKRAERCWLTVLTASKVWLRFSARTVRMISFARNVSTLLMMLRNWKNTESKSWAYQRSKGFSFKITSCPQNQSAETNGRNSSSSISRCRRTTICLGSSKPTFLTWKTLTLDWITSMTMRHWT